MNADANRIIGVIEDLRRQLAWRSQ